MVRGPLTVVASPVAEHRLRTHRLSSHGSRNQPLRDMWDSPGLGQELISPASAGGLPATAPPGKPLFIIFTGIRTQQNLSAQRSIINCNSALLISVKSCIIKYYIMYFRIQILPLLFISYVTANKPINIYEFQFTHH